jgi:riboflavin synthase
MFTGIIEAIGTVRAIKPQQNNLVFEIESLISNGLRIDQSLSHNGVCLTVTEVGEGCHSVTAIRETLLKTNLSDWKTGSLLNLERCMPANGRFDGHIVQGHVDQIGFCRQILDEQGSWRFTFEYDPSLGNLTVEKGSICVNGTSLTVVDSQKERFSVAIIPYTFEHTNFQAIKVGDAVNLEFDILGKYIARMMNARQ